MFDTSLPKKVMMTIGKEKAKVVELMTSQGISYDEPADYTAVIERNEKFIATGSLKRNVIKYVAVDSQSRNEGLTNKIVTHLMQIASYNGETHLFIYTKPENEKIFHELGFNTILLVQGKVLLMENKRDGIESYIQQLKKVKVNKKNVAAIVVNCNPFTLGHQYVIETAARHNDWLHIFVVHEDQSSFPTQVRLRLVKEGTEHLSNVRVHDGGNYIISAATFPSYFLKEKQEVNGLHASLDLSLFGQFIAPALSIKRRYIGEEPYCQVTNQYNKKMKELLPGYGIEVTEIPRKAFEGKAISASLVRQCLVDEEYEALEQLVPKTTLQFMLSPEGQEIVISIKNNNQRH